MPEVASTRKYCVATLLSRSYHVHCPATAVGVSVWMVVHVAPSTLRCSEIGTDAAVQKIPTVVTKVASEKFTSRTVEVS